MVETLAATVANGVVDVVAAVADAVMVAIVERTAAVIADRSGVVSGHPSRAFSVP